MRNFRTVFYAPLPLPRRASTAFVRLPAAAGRLALFARRLLTTLAPPRRSPPSDLTQVDKDLRQMLLRPDAPAPRKVAVRVWPRAIPQASQARARRARRRPAGGGRGARSPLLPHSVCALNASFVLPCF